MIFWMFSFYKNTDILIRSVISDIKSDELYFTITWNVEKKKAVLKGSLQAAVVSLLAVLKLYRTLRENWKIKGNTEIY